MEIIVGAPTASVQWLREEPWDCRVSVSSEHVDDETPTEIAGNGQHSELKRRWWIDTPAARVAVRHHFLTGELTQAVRWESF